MEKKPRAGKKLPKEGSTAPGDNNKVQDSFAGDPNCYTFGASWRTGKNRCFRGNQGCDQLALYVIEEETLF